MLERAELRAFFHIRLPLRIRLHRRALLRAVGRILVAPDVNVLVDVAGLRLQIGERLAQMPRLRPLAEFLVEREMLLDRAGTAGVRANVEQHVFLLIRIWVRCRAGRAGASESLEPISRSRT